MQISEIKNLCNQLGLHPSKNLGQNFLLDKSVVEKMVETAELNEKDTVLEIGPGFGVLTEELVKRAGRVIAVEKDRRLVEFLATRDKRQGIKNNLEIVNDDILRFKIYDLGFKNYKIVANLPYQITSPVLWKFLMEEKEKPESLIIMVQKEVGERICAAPGEMSILSVMCQYFSTCEFLFIVPRESFYPVPAVDSAVVRFKIYDLGFKNKKSEIDEKDFIRLVKFGFSARRKMLKNNLSAGLQKPMAEVVKALKLANLDEKVRAQELSVDDWIKLYKKLVEINRN